jgi:hypothetical protein
MNGGTVFLAFPNGRIGIFYSTHVDNDVFSARAGKS